MPDGFSTSMRARDFAQPLPGHRGAVALPSVSVSISSTQGIRPEAGAGPLVRLHSLHRSATLDGATQSADGALSGRLHSSQINDGSDIRFLQTENCRRYAHQLSAATNC